MYVPCDLAQPLAEFHEPWIRISRGVMAAGAVFGTSSASSCLIQHARQAVPCYGYDTGREAATQIEIAGHLCCSSLSQRISSCLLV